MHRFEGKKRRGFVLVYTLLIVSICAAAALACFRLQVLARDNSISCIKLVQKQDVVQRDREYLLNEVDGFICSRLETVTVQGIRELFASETGFRAGYGESSAQYLASKDAFYLCYSSGGRFLMEELCRYEAGERGAVYSTTAFSYKKGELAK
jgi:hypothetical protein